MMPVSAETFRMLDAMAEQQGISTLALMENAGEAVAKKADRLLKTLKGKRVAVFCGKGNNGGDGLVAARKLKRLNVEVSVFILSKEEDLKNEAALNLRSFIDAGGKVEEITSEEDLGKIRKRLDCSLIIDALLGTGLSGSLSGIFKHLIEILNASNIPILSVDIPSGLNATTGEISPIAINANWTISFALPKKGFYKNSGPDYAKSVEVVNIGFPKELLNKTMEYEKSICGK